MPEFTLDVPFRLSNPWEFPRFGVPLRASIPLPAGAVGDPAAEMALVDEQGRDVGAQWKVLSTWQDGSARFALMDYAAHLERWRSAGTLEGTRTVARDPS